MSAISQSDELNASIPRARPRPATGDRVLQFACSVRLGVGLLIAIVLLSLVGMAVMQQNVPGFAAYYAAMGEPQRSLFLKLGLFDIYHSWYYTLLLSALTLNIILATVDRLPRIWHYRSRPAKAAPVRWLESRTGSVSISTELPPDKAAALASEALTEAGFTPTASSRMGRRYLFAERGVWNRYAFVAVHIGLLAILFGGFISARFSSVGDLPLAPGESSDIMFDVGFKADEMVEITKRLPFQITAVDLSQKLIRQDGPITDANTIDRVTRFTITDENGVHPAEVGINRPFDYRGYRFFQGDAGKRGRARSVTLTAFPADGGTGERVVLDRNGTATLANGTAIRLAGFRGNYHGRPESPAEDTTAYPNPAALIEVISGSSSEVTPVFPEGVGTAPAAARPSGGYRFVMADFERVADRHQLFIQRDPGVSIVYFGSAVLIMSLAAVFFFSHRRIWVAVEELPGPRSKLTIAGDANRSQEEFAGETARIAQAVRKRIDMKIKKD